MPAGGAAAQSGSSVPLVGRFLFSTESFSASWSVLNLFLLKRIMTRARCSSNGTSGQVQGRSLEMGEGGRPWGLWLWPGRGWAAEQALQGRGEALPGVSTTSWELLTCSPKDAWLQPERRVAAGGNSGHGEPGWGQAEGPWERSQPGGCGGGPVGACCFQSFYTSRWIGGGRWFQDSGGKHLSEPTGNTGGGHRSLVPLSRVTEAALTAGGWGSLCPQPHASDWNLALSLLPPPLCMKTPNPMPLVSISPFDGA